MVKATDLFGRSLFPFYIVQEIDKLYIQHICEQIQILKVLTL